MTTQYPIEDLELYKLKTANIQFQALSRYVVCVTQPTHPYLQLVNSNTMDNWIIYYASCDSHIYSKGIHRLNLWIFLHTSRLFETIPNNIKYFVLSGLIILLQVYGDGNHRTASYFYNLHTNDKLNIDLIKRVRYEFNQDIHDIEGVNIAILQLITEYTQNIS